MHKRDIYSQLASQMSGEDFKRFHNLGEPLRPGESAAAVGAKYHSEVDQHILDAITYGKSLLVGTVPKVEEKSKLVFYKSLSKAVAIADRSEGKARYISGKMRPTELRSTIEAFEARKFQTLYVHIAYALGWRCRLTTDECEVKFLAGDNFRPEEMAQTKGRLIPASWPTPTPGPAVTAPCWYDNIPDSCEYTPAFLKRVAELPPHKWPFQDGSICIVDMDRGHLKGTMDKIHRSWPPRDKNVPQEIKSRFSRMLRALKK